MFFFRLSLFIKKGKIYFLLKERDNEIKYFRLLGIPQQFHSLLSYSFFCATIGLMATNVEMGWSFLGHSTGC